MATSFAGLPARLKHGVDECYGTDRVFSDELTP
jgi:hypothetical protein